MSYFDVVSPEVNNEIIASLDDESLYRLCYTSSDMYDVCSLPAVWNIDRSSPLIPLYLLRNKYQNWLDFYENVLDDYVYVLLVVHGTNTIAVRIFSDIKEAFVELLSRIKYELGYITRDWRKQLLNDYPTYVNQDLSQYLDNTTTRQLAIGLARKNTVHKQTMPYDYLLYKAEYPNINITAANLLAFPNLHPIDNTAIAYKNIDKLNTDIYYGDVNDEFLAYITLHKYSMFKVSDDELVLNLVPIHNIYYGLLFDMDDMLSAIIVLTSDILIDGSNKYRIVTLPFYTDTNYTTNYLRNEDDSYKVAAFLKRYGTFYELEDLSGVIESFHK